MTKPLSTQEKERRRMARLLSPKRRLNSFMTTRCADRTCGTCIRCVRARQWATGKYAHGPNPGRRTWTPEMTARLEELAGTMDRREIARIIWEEYPHWRPKDRDQACAIRASRDGISLWPPGRSIWEVQTMLGVTQTRVESWIELGWLRPFPFVSRAGSALTRWRIRDDDLADFIRHHSEHFDVRPLIGSGPLIDLARSYASRRTPQRFSKPHPSWKRIQQEVKTNG